ncbi:SsgA family sporulation/cell division regulator [Nonomuraea basaltis]|uniref:SsgA family sporulation/cell division regulator n=1 Tax=Nonomuraea basaltis TaxID=2495887 RepID=UPI00110C58F0|nr:SsgA family sporulation/cell division regulator [Nonomuraea basaltis]
MGRDLLHDGLLAPTGIGDVRVWPSSSRMLRRLGTRCRTSCSSDISASGPLLKTCLIDRRTHRDHRPSLDEADLARRRGSRLTASIFACRFCVRP